MTPLEVVVGELIRRRGPLTFAAYQELALYHPEHGYYAGPERASRAGDYLTSPELDPAFGCLWATGLQGIWDACGRPASFRVVELGPGEGGFAAALLSAASGDFGRALSMALVERSPAVAARQKERLGGDARVTWCRSLSDLPVAGAGCVVANEVLDNAPVHLLEGTQAGPLELFVDLSSDGLVLTPGALSSEATAALGSGAWHAPGLGEPAEISPAAEQLCMQAASCNDRGGVVVIDYGYEVRRARGTLVCYSSGGADDDPLAAPGAKDITTHVDWRAVAGALRRAGCAVTGPRTQSATLRALGASELDAGLRGAHLEATAGGRGAEAVRALSRRAALAALLDSGGLGGLGVLLGVKNCPPPAFWPGQ